MLSSDGAPQSALIAGVVTAVALILALLAVALYLLLAARRMRRRAEKEAQAALAATRHHLQRAEAASAAAALLRSASAEPQAGATSPSSADENDSASPPPPVQHAARLSLLSTALILPAFAAEFSAVGDGVSGIITGSRALRGAAARLRQANGSAELGGGGTADTASSAAAVSLRAASLVPAIIARLQAAAAAAADEEALGAEAHEGGATDEVAVAVDVHEGEECIGEPEIATAASSARPSGSGVAVAHRVTAAQRSRELRSGSGGGSAGIERRSLAAAAAITRHLPASMLHRVTASTLETAGRLMSSPTLFAAAAARAERLKPLPHDPCRRAMAVLVAAAVEDMTAAGSGGSRRLLSADDVRSLRMLDPSLKKRCAAALADAAADVIATSSPDGASDGASGSDVGAAADAAKRTVGSADAVAMGVPPHLLVSDAASARGGSARGRLLSSAISAEPMDPMADLSAALEVLVAGTLTTAAGAAAGVVASSVSDEDVRLAVVADKVRTHREAAAAAAGDAAAAAAGSAAASAAASGGGDDAAAAARPPAASTDASLVAAVAALDAAFLPAAQSGAAPALSRCCGRFKWGSALATPPTPASILTQLAWGGSGASASASASSAAPGRSGSGSAHLGSSASGAVARTRRATALAVQAAAARSGGSVGKRSAERTASSSAGSAAAAPTIPRFLLADDALLALYGIRGAAFRVRRSPRASSAGAGGSHERSPSGSRASASPFGAPRGGGRSSFGSDAGSSVWESKQQSPPATPEHRAATVPSPLRPETIELLALLARPSSAVGDGGASVTVSPLRRAHGAGAHDPSMRDSDSAAGDSGDAAAAPPPLPPFWLVSLLQQQRGAGGDALRKKFPAVQPIRPNGAPKLTTAMTASPRNGGMRPAVASPAAIGSAANIAANTAANIAADAPARPLPSLPPRLGSGISRRSLLSRRPSVMTRSTRTGASVARDADTASRTATTRAARASMARVVFNSGAAR